MLLANLFVQVGDVGHDPVHGVCGVVGMLNNSHKNPPGTVGFIEQGKQRLGTFVFIFVAGNADKNGVDMVIGLT